MALESEMKQEKDLLSSAMKTTYLSQTLTLSYEIGDCILGHPLTKNRNQIDFALGNRRWRCLFIAEKLWPDADCGTDHELLQATVTFKVKNI